MIRPSRTEIAPEYKTFAHPNPMLFREVYKLRGIDDLSSSLKYQTEFINIETLTGSQNILILPEEDQQKVEDERAQVNAHIQTISEETDLPLPHMDQPLYVDFDIHSGYPNILKTIKKYRDNPEVLGQLAACLADPSRLEMNQAGLFHEDVLTAVHALFPNIAIHPDFQRRIRSSVNYVDKTISVDLVNNAPHVDLPKHAISRTYIVEDVLTAQSYTDLKKSWEDIGGCSAQTDTIVVKLGPDSGGEGVFLVRPDNFAHFRQKLQKLPDTSMKCMLQEPICVPRTSPNGLPNRTSLDFVIGGKKSIQYVGSAGQISADEECTEYLGSVWRYEDDEAVLQSIGPHRLQNLCNLYAERGYIGPIGFDFLMDEDGEYNYIFDCNPRRTANQYVYNMKDYMHRNGIRLKTLANVGRSGMFKTPNLSETLQDLKQRNVLMTPYNGQGTLLLPHLNGGFDVHFANFEDVQEILNWSDALRQHDNNFPSLYL